VVFIYLFPFLARVKMRGLAESISYCYLTPVPVDTGINPAYLLKFALTDKLALTVTVQVGVTPVHAPDQALNVLPAGGVAVNTTTVPGAIVAVHASPQLIPPTSLVTVPELLELTLSCRLLGGVTVPPPPPPVAPPAAPPPPPVAGAVLKVAVAVFEPFTVTTQTPVPAQTPDQPAKTLPLLDLAVNVTTVPAA
jgi:hypothetical protein